MCSAAWIFGLQPVNFALHWGTNWPGKVSKEWLFHRFTLNYSSLWEHKNLHCFKGFQGRQTQLRSMDTRNRGNNLEIWAEMCERAPLELLQTLSHRPSPYPLPGKLTLAPTQQLLLLLQKFTFDSPLCMGSARTYCTIPWKPWSIWLIHDPCSLSEDPGNGYK